VTEYRKLRVGDDPFGALTNEQMSEALAITDAMARQQVLNGDGFPIAVDEFYEGTAALRRQMVKNRQAAEWSDYRKDYGVSESAMSEAHRAFIAGWEAALGKSYEGGPLR